MKKNLCLLLSLLLLATSLAACGGEKETTPSPDTSSSESASDTTPAETEAPKAEDTLTITKYGGKEYKMISTDQDSRAVDICAEEINGNTLNDLVYNRNAKVMDLYDVTMTADRNVDYSQITEMVRKATQSGESPYHLYLTNQTAIGLASGGYLYDFYKMPYVNVSQPWWDQNQVQDMTIRGKLFMAIGDISPTELLTSECLLFNKRLFDENHLTYPYEDALNGTWTFDKLYAICDGLTKDLNGDGEIKVNDDMFSLTCWGDYPNALFFGAGGSCSSVNEDGYIELKVDTEKITNIYDKIYQVLVGREANYETVDHERSFRVFKEGRAYFCGITFQKIDTFLREMEDDYGVLPNPKFDETQKNYSTCVSGAGSMVIVPKNCPEVEFVGNLMEAMAATSYDLITPDLINVIASTKNVRDLESSQITQMIIRNRCFDAARMHDVNVEGIIQPLLKKKSTDVASSLAKESSKWQKAIDKVNTAYAKLED